MEEKMEAVASNPMFSTRLARGPREILEAQRLRYRVFGEEMGARLPHAALGVDRDRFDRWCDHLLVQEDATGRIVGTYRILPATRALAIGGFYCDTEFDTRRLQALGTRVIEVGRACIDPEFRTGAVLGMLWAGLARYIKTSAAKYVIGCASVPVGDDDPTAAVAVCRRLLDAHASPAAWRVTPYRPFPLGAADTAPERRTAVPPLLKGYLRMGATVCGAPAWDPDFRTADLLVLLSVEQMNARYAGRLFRAA